MYKKENFRVTDVFIQLEQMDFTTVAQVLIPIVSYYTVNKVIDGYQLHKDFKPKNISKISLPPELRQEYSSVDIEKLAAQRFGEAVVEFAKTIMENFSTKDLTNFYNNLNELTISSSKFKYENLVLKMNTAATYNSKKNQILVDADDYTSTIYHELFHMASSTYKNGIHYSGFRQISQKSDTVNLGKAINEGYTQLLTERYFDYIDEVHGGYDFEVYIAKKLEQIVEQDKMERLYLNSDLLGFINELKKYVSLDEIMQFISETDFLTNHLEDQRMLPFEKGMITHHLKSVTNFLVRTYASKLKQQEESGSLKDGEFKEKLETYALSLITKFNVGKYHYEALTLESLQENLRTVLGDHMAMIADTPFGEPVSKHK